MREAYDTGALARLARKRHRDRILFRVIYGVFAVAAIVAALVLAGSANGARSTRTWSPKELAYIESSGVLTGGCRTLEDPCAECDYTLLQLYVPGGQVSMLTAAATTTDESMPDGGTMRTHRVGGTGLLEFIRPDLTTGSCSVGPCDIVIERTDAQGNAVYLWVWFCETP